MRKVRFTCRNNQPRTNFSTDFIVNLGELGGRLDLKASFMYSIFFDMEGLSKVKLRYLNISLFSSRFHSLFHLYCSLGPLF